MRGDLGSSSGYCILGSQNMSSCRGIGIRLGLRCRGGVDILLLDLLAVNDKERADTAENDYQGYNGKDDGVCR
jgi:hypothetical protein